MRQSWIPALSPALARLTGSFENRLVIETLREAFATDPKRKAFRLVGGVLVERTVADVLPELEERFEQVRWRYCFFHPSRNGELMYVGLCASRSRRLRRLCSRSTRKRLVRLTQASSTSNLLTHQYVVHRNQTLQTGSEPTTVRPLLPLSIRPPTLHFTIVRFTVVVKQRP